jgi:hypothetical protein
MISSRADVERHHAVLADAVGKNLRTREGIGYPVKIALQRAMAEANDPDRDVVGSLDQLPEGRVLIRTRSDSHDDVTDCEIPDEPRHIVDSIAVPAEVGSPQGLAGNWWPATLVGRKVKHNFDARS